MNNQLLNPLPPFVWTDPRVLKGELCYQDATPFESFVPNATSIFGIVHGIDHSGVEWLAQAFRRASELRGRILLVVSAGCATVEEDLRQLIVLQSELSPRLEIHIRPLQPVDERPTNAVCCITPQESEGLLFVGSSVNFNQPSGDNDRRAAAANFVWRCDGALRKSFCDWFDWLWLNSSLLTDETAAIPRLVPARGTPEAGEMWAAYVEKCRVEAEQRNKEKAEAIEKAVAGNGSAPNEETEQSVTKELGVPSLDEVGERIARVLSLGSQVTIDKATRIPPLDAPIKPEWFGVESLRHIGAVSRKVEYRVSVINEKTLRELDNKRKMTRTLLDRLSFPLGEGVRWMPQNAFPIFEREMERVNKDGQALLKSALGDKPETFIESQRKRIYADADMMYKDFQPGEALPEETFAKILADLKERLQKAGVGSFLPQVSRLGVSFKVGSGSQWESAWGQALTFLQAVAEFPRKALTDSFFLRGLRVDRNELLEAMNVCEDSLIARHKSENVERQAKDELALLGRIEAAEIETRIKCEAVLNVLDGVSGEVIEKRLAEAAKQFSENGSKQTEQASQVEQTAK